MIAAEVHSDRAIEALQHFPGAAGRALSRAVNRAVEEAYREAVARITERYAIKQGDVAARLGISTGTPTKPEANLIARARAFSMAYFPHSPSSSGTGGRGRPPLRAEILRGSQKEVSGGFVGRDKIGNLRIFKRGQGRTATGKGRLEALHTVNVATMLSVHNVREAVEKAARDKLDATLEVEITRELERGE